MRGCTASPALTLGAGRPTCRPTAAAAGADERVLRRSTTAVRSRAAAAAAGSGAGMHARGAASSCGRKRRAGSSRSTFAAGQLRGLHRIAVYNVTMALCLLASEPTPACGPQVVKRAAHQVCILLPDHTVEAVLPQQCRHLLQPAVQVMHLYAYGKDCGRNTSALQPGAACGCRACKQPWPAASPPWPPALPGASAVSRYLPAPAARLAPRRP